MTLLTRLAGLSPPNPLLEDPVIQTPLCRPQPVPVPLVRVSFPRILCLAADNDSIPTVECGWVLSIVARVSGTIA